MESTLLPPARRARVRASALLAGALLLAGCSSLEGLFDGGLFGGSEMSNAAASTDGAALDERPSLEALAAAAPELAAGDRFTFDNPTVTWTVERVEDDRIYWRADNGDEQVTAQNVILPALAWSSAGQGRGRRLITEMSAPFFPLRAGKRVTFNSTVSTDAPPYAWEFTWACETLGAESVAVPAGRFDAYVIQCGRQRPDELTFHYAPAVGHYVRLVSRPATGGAQQSFTRELTDFMSRRYIAYVDPKTSALASELAAEPPPTPTLSDAAMDAARPPASPMTAAPLGEVETDGAGAKAGGREPGPVVVAPVAPAPQSDLSDEGRARSAAEAAPAPAANGRTAPSQPEASAAPTGGMTEQQAAASGAAALHLASYKQSANAERGWRQLSGANADLLGGARPIVRQVDVPGKGMFYRLYAGPIASMEDARALCRALKARNVYCAPMRL
ncbi:MAG: SPOR domain-containing protein [Alphaproteobacteria bacterium]|nr:SPOR domain-containing protein [Alphaproteobacteria bacterium]